MDNTLTDFLNAFSKTTKYPYDYLSVQEELAENVKGLIKHLYDHTKANENEKYKNTLPKLIVQEFDEEQIWQQLELQNGSFSDNVIQIVSQLVLKKDKLNFPLKLKCIQSEAEEIPANTNVKIEEGEEEVEESDLEHDEEDDEMSDAIDEDLSEEETRSPIQKSKLKPSIVDDKFFKLSELELFLQSEEKNDGKPCLEKETLDLFTNSDEEDAADYKYSDFFENPEREQSENEKIDQSESDDDSDEIGEENDKELSAKKPKRKHSESNDLNSDNKEDEEEESTQKKKKVRFSLLESEEEESSSEDDSDNKPKDLFGLKKPEKQSDKIKSSLEQRQERLGQMIEKLEEEAMSEKPWQLSGEVSANTRPQNSLLEEVVDFDISVRPAPVMTGEVTLKLEDIIIQRIKDKAWDDVERKVKPVETPSEFKKKLALDQEKSKLSLAEVYEKEFIKQREATTADETEKQEVEPPLHVEVRSMLNSLFNKLDALSNYHFTPRPVAPELKVISNVAAITMEEVAPVSVADSALLAPQEIKRQKRRSELMSKEERTTTDKKRARRIKKTKQRQRQREKEKAAKEIAKINPGMGNKYSKLKAQEQVWKVTSSNVTKMDESKDKVVKSSTSFFNKLQDEVKNTIKSKTSTFAKKNDKKKITAKKLKL